MQTDPVHELSEKLTLLHEVYSRRISDRALSLWIDKLSSFIGPELDKVLEDAMLQRSIPTLGDLVQTTIAARSRAKNQTSRDDDERLTPAEIQRRDAVARQVMAELKEKLGI